MFMFIERIVAREVLPSGYHQPGLSNGNYRLSSRPGLLEHVSAARRLADLGSGESTTICLYSSLFFFPALWAVNIN
jgi:hypothetical protein